MPGGSEGRAEIDAFMRHADDLSDDPALPMQEKQQKLQAWLDERELLSTFTNLVESVIDVFLAQSIDRRIHAADSFLRKARTASVFANTANMSVAFLNDHHQPAAAASDADDATGFHHFV